MKEIHLKYYIRKISNVDLASSIRAAFNLHNYRRNEHTDYLFILTDG